MPDAAPGARHAPPAEGAEAPGGAVGAGVRGGVVGAAMAMASPAEQPGMLMGEDRSGGDEPPTIDADDGEEPSPSITPAGPGSLSFPPVKPTAPSLATGPGSVPRGAMPQSDGSCVHSSKGGDTCRREEDSGFVTADTEAQYQEKIGECLGYILEGESYELCLTTRHRSRRSMVVDALRFYQRLRTVNPAPYSALLRCGKGLTVCSSSPERFLRIDADGLCDSKPIKGTRRRGSCPQEDAAISDELRSCEKDLAENLMIVDLVRNDLGRVCTEASVCCPKLMDVETYATVRALAALGSALRLCCRCALPVRLQRRVPSCPRSASAQERYWHYTPGTHCESREGRRKGRKGRGARRGTCGVSVGCRART